MSGLEVEGRSFTGLSLVVQRTWETYCAASPTKLTKTDRLKASATPRQM